MLVTFEGGEGCGKSTQIKKFKEYLEKEKIDYLITREPGGTEVGEQIREILLHGKSNLSSETEFLLFSASRSKLVEEVVKPALAEGKVVVLDRYYDSSYTYQGYAGNLNLQDLKSITQFAIKGAVPDLTILLDLPYEVGMSRKSKDENLKNLDRIEQKGKTYHDSVRAGYLKLAKEEPKRIFVVDASKSANDVHKAIIEEFERRFRR
ncbi:MAG: dTMP kinase [Candidatus Caccovivens sp.]